MGPVNTLSQKKKTHKKKVLHKDEHECKKLKHIGSIYNRIVLDFPVSHPGLHLQISITLFSISESVCYKLKIMLGVAMMPVGNLLPQATYLSPTCSDAFKMLAWQNWTVILSLCVK